MDELTLRQLKRELKWLRENACVLREGTVTDDSPYTITLGGSTETITNPPTLDSYTPVANDRIHVLVAGRALLVLGD